MRKRNCVKTATQYNAILRVLHNMGQNDRALTRLSFANSELTGEYRMTQSDLVARRNELVRKGAIVYRLGDLKHSEGWVLGRNWEAFYTDKAVYLSTKID